MNVLRVQKKNVLSHVDVITSGPPGSVGSLLSFDGDGLQWNNTFFKVKTTSFIIREDLQKYNNMTVLRENKGN